MYRKSKQTVKLVLKLRQNYQLHLYPILSLPTKRNRHLKMSLKIKKKTKIKISLKRNQIMKNKTNHILTIKQNKNLCVLQDPVKYHPKLNIKNQLNRLLKSFKRKTIKKLHTLKQ